MSKVSLVGITQPDYETTGCTDAAELVAWAARVSNPSNQQNHETAPKLLRYLIENQHWSPLEMVHITMRISTTRDIARQILRHRSFSFQEYSQRYADPTKDLGFTLRETRLQDAKNRQNSVQNDDEELHDAWLDLQAEVLEVTKRAYGFAIENGIAKEQARAVLPEGLTESVLIVAGSLRSFWHYILVRHHPDTQKEHRIVAEQISEIIMHRFPDMSDLLRDMISENYR